MKRKIGFISTRFSGVDGVSLEASKWAMVLESMGHSCYWFAGELDQQPENGFLVPEAHFLNEEIDWLNEQILGKKVRDVAVTDEIHALRQVLKIKIYEFVRKFNIDLLIVQNALSIPMNIPLGVALTEVISEMRIPTIAHHHDFWWERTRYLINSCWDYIRMAFPPNLPNIKHVVINSTAQEELALRTGITSIIIPNVLNFENPPPINKDRAKKWRTDLGLDDDDIMILNPTRIVDRKGIELAIELVKELKDPRFKLVVSHQSGDEGFEYAKWLTSNALLQGVDLRLFDAHIGNPLSPNGDHQQEYSLWDIYPYADFITYPSLYEGFGNGFLEAIYFKKPILINRYSTFIRDIEPKGFNFIVIDRFLTGETVRKVKEILNSPGKNKDMVNLNYKIASRHYSFTELRKYLSGLVVSIFGVD